MISTERRNRAGETYPARYETERARQAFAPAGAFAFLLVAGCGEAGDPREIGAIGRSSAAIVNGTTTDAYPAVVAIAPARGRCGQTFEPHCTGTLVAPRVVLTAAHCLPLSSSSLFDVYFGNDASAGGAVLRGTARVHPSYVPTGTSHDFDFGVVILDDDAAADPLPFASAAPSTSDVGASVTMVGFGIVGPGTTPDGKKRQGTGTLSEIGSLDLRVLPAPSVTCTGDSGGPVLKKDAQGVERVVGVTSWGDSACTQFGAAGRVDVVLDGFLTPILKETAAAQPPRPLLPATDLCTMTCSTQQDCPAGTVCVLRGQQQVCELPGFGRGVVGGSCAAGDGCGHCLLVAPATSTCGCVTVCGGGADGGAPPPDASPNSTPKGCSAAPASAPGGVAARLVFAAGVFVGVVRRRVRRRGKQDLRLCRH